MTEKMQEVARPVPPGGAFQGGSLQGLSLRRDSLQAGPSKVFSLEISKKLRGKQKNCGKVLDKSAGIWYDI